MRNTDNFFLNTFLVKKVDERVSNLIPAQLQTTFYGPHIQLKALWRKFRTHKFYATHQRNPIHNSLNPQQKQQNRDFRMSTQTSNITCTIQKRDMLQKLEKTYQKTFNRTKIDLEHNFTGKKYLKKIEEQKKRQKTEPARQFKNSQMQKSNVSIPKKDSFLDRIIDNRSKYNSQRKMQLFKKKNLRCQNSKKRIRIFKKAKKIDRMQNLGDQALQTTKKLLKISTQLSEQQQKIIKNQQKLRFRQLIETIKISPWQKSSIDDIPNEFERKKY